MAVKRPHQAAYWQVELAHDRDRHAEIKAWCRSNITPAPRCVTWIAPQAPRAGVEWYDGNRSTTETWHFSRHEDAVMFDMVWNDAWQER
jgi:flavin-dependent dehydrogenase